MTAQTDNRPLYVRRLDAERKAAEYELEALHAGLNELKLYLHSDKFLGAGRDYVNVQDVLLRLGETTYNAVVASEKAYR